MWVDEAVVLAGGLGTRLRAVVSDVPKPLAPVAGRPFLAWLLDGLAMQDMRRIVLATGHMAEKVEAAIGTRWAGMEIAYSVEDKPLGTGGALRLALSKLAGDAVHVLNGDTFLRYSLRGLENAACTAGVPAAIALARVDDVSRYGAVDVEDGKVIGFREKGGHGAGWINAGSYFLGVEALQALPTAEAFSLETGYLYPQAAIGGLAGYTESTGFIDIGVPEDFARAQTLFGGKA